MASLAGRQPGPAPLVLQLFSRRWWWVTLLVIAAVGVMAGLGSWVVPSKFTVVKAYLEHPGLDLIQGANIKSLLLRHLSRHFFRKVSRFFIYNHFSILYIY